MASHNDLGKKGEELAAAWLAEKGYTILHQNWRHSYHEIDIIASKGKFLHFIEVKTLKENSLGNPEDSVTKKKFSYLKNAADEYLFRNPGHQWIQYDIISIRVYANKEPEFFMLEDVFL
ncbi:MAG TPA: YraN family protein [Chitinophagaceae bacterium]|nr:YraN family protein [Chitinophagaceae bacterium]HPG12342.1 YraN family protein [Chitinophagaceae bacterium]HRX93364.1 YraN family protein [Chitinophagaceae bacterium]